jgi:ABC-type lipoprotein release transport system permease subunit
MYRYCQLFLSNLRFYALSHLGTMLGVVVASAVLVGALAVGDSVRGSLLDLALARIGRIDFALAAQDRFFRSALADDLRPDISNHLATAVLQLPGTVALPDDSARANQVQVLGVDTNFFALARQPASLDLTQPDTVLLNAPLAAQLQVKIGDAIVLHVKKPSLLSEEAPLSPQQDVATGFRLTVGAIVSDAQGGRFSLQASQVQPLNAYVPLGFLQEQTELAGKANLLLTGVPETGVSPDQLLRRNWTRADASLEIRSTPNGWELRSGRIFIDPAIVHTVQSVTPAPGPQLYLTYFVNEIRNGQKTTPYSMVTAADPSMLPAHMADDEIIIDRWLADDLQAKKGDEIRLSGFVLGTNHRLEEQQENFRVRGIAPMEGMAADRTFLPDFPGIATAETTGEWDAGFPIDMQKILPKDEQYWKEYRGTPKAFVTLAAGQRMWGNRFGNVTALRFTHGQPSPEELLPKIMAGLEPAALGLVFQPLRERALAASSQSQDFGGLFLGFSFFLIIAALILLALLFQFGLEKRATEVGTLLALGWTPGKVRRLFLLEGFTIAIIGGWIGSQCGIYYARGILWGLANLWQSAVVSSPLKFSVSQDSIVTGAGAGVIVSTIVILLTSRSQCKRPARELLERGHELEAQAAANKRKRGWSVWIASITGIAGLASLGWGINAGGKADVETFFSAGALLLIAGIATVAALFRALARRSAQRPLSLTSLALRGCTRRSRRSVATVALLASGSFLIVAVAANKLDAARDSRQRSSGTGGFALIGQSALPIVQDLNNKSGRDFFSIDEKTMTNAQVVPLRVHEGDDVSCLNLNRPQTPRLLGVDPNEFQNRGAFTFSKIIDPGFAQKAWLLLTNFNTNANEIPAVGDETSLEWILHKQIGDTIDYTDDHGRPFKIRIVGALANSALQGNLIIDSAAFTRVFPGDSGWRMFLIDAPAEETTNVSVALTRALRDRGLELMPTADRLNAYNAVQNTYLDTFQVLGGLGLLLGSGGLGVVVLRNVLERRAELAVLQAAGFRRRTVRRLVLSEHAALECLGLLVGIIAALAAILPALLSLAAPVSYQSLAITLGLVFVSGLLWTWLAARLALRGDLLAALRNE